MPDMKNTITLLNDRSLIQIGGPDAFSFLQGLVSNDLDSFTSNKPGFTTLLTPQGKILFDFFVIPHKENFLLDCDRQTSPALLKRLKLYKLRANVTLEDVSEEIAVIATVSNNLIQTSPPDSLMLFVDPRLATLGYRLYGEKSTITSYLNQHDTLTTSLTAYRYHCIQQGVPTIGAGFESEKMFLLDVNYDLLNAVSYQKGCFVGQEVTSRMKRKGEVRKRTLIVNHMQITTPSLEKGNKVIAGDATIGEMLFAEENIGLAMIRMDRLNSIDKSNICVNGKPVTIEQPAYMKSG